MIDLKDLRDHPDRYRDGVRRKRMSVDIDRILELDARRRALLTEQERLQAEQNRAAKESGPRIGQLTARLTGLDGDARAEAEREIEALKAAPARLKAEIAALEERAREIAPELDALLLTVPLPPDPDVPDGAGAEDNVEIRRWAPGLAGEPIADGPGGSGAAFDPASPFSVQRGFRPRGHDELLAMHGWVDVERGIKVAGSRSYVLRGDGYRLHQAVLRAALDLMVDRHGFVPVTAPSLVREEAMVGTGFFPAGREQTYQVEETRRGGGYDLFLAGTGEVGLMGLHQGEIIDEADLPLRYVTLSPCYRREAGAAGKDTAGLYRVHQFDKVEQVVIDRADEANSRAWHARMIAFVEEFLRSLGLPYRLLQCCAGDLGVKNADMVDIECWMPSRGETRPDGEPAGDWGETHSASRLYDYQCRRLTMRYRPGGEGGKGPTTFCHSLNNTVAASPRILIPLLEIHQREDGSIWVPPPLRPYLGGRDHLGG